MRRRLYPSAQPIGFLTRRGPVPPYQYPAYPQAPYYSPHQPFFPHSNGTIPPTFSSPPTQPQPPGIGGVLQNLFKGKGSFDINSVMTNAQKVIGVVNQLGSVVRNMSPMLEMIKGLSDDSPLIETDEHEHIRKRRRKHKKNRKWKRKAKSKSRGYRKTSRRYS